MIAFGIPTFFIPFVGWCAMLSFAHVILIIFALAHAARDRASA
jgi:hypothetical protein